MMPPSDAAPQTKVFVGRLSSVTKSMDLRKLFERFGEVTECDVLGTYGFVHMKSVEQAETAIQKLNGTDLHGSRISVEPSTGQKGRGGGRGRGGGPMRGGRGLGGYRGRGSDRFEPYGRSYPPASDSYGGGYGNGGGYGDGYGSSYNSYGGGSYGGSYGGGASYGNGYGMDRRPPPVRTAVGGYYDEYDRRDPYARSPAPRPAYDAYERRPPPRDPYASSGYDSRGQSSYDRRDDYGDMYSRRSPARYQSEAAPSRGYDGYDRYASAAPRGASPPRRYAPQHRELTTVRRY